jgi:hypothetical protein
MMGYVCLVLPIVLWCAESRCLVTGTCCAASNQFPAAAQLRSLLYQSALAAGRFLWSTYARRGLYTLARARADACTTLTLFVCAQYLFGTGIGDVSQLSPAQVYDRAVRGIGAVQERYTALSLAPAEPSSMGGGASNSADASSGTSASALITHSGRDYARSSMGILDHGHLVNYGGKSLHIDDCCEVCYLGLWSANRHQLRKVLHCNRILKLYITLNATCS